MYRRLTYLLGTLPVIALGNTASGIVVDGSRAGDGYGPPISVQTVQTGFGDNQSELDAVYARVADDQLYLMFTGNLENNWNRLNIFIDSAPGGMNEVYRPGSTYDRFTFDAGFAPEYLLEAVAGPSNFIFYYTHFDSDISTGSDKFSDVFDGVAEGATQTAPGATHNYSFGLGFDNSNMLGVTGGTEAADPVAAAAVMTGIELGIPLGAIGNPDVPFKVMAMINGAGADFLSNQILGGLTPAQENLGSDGLGNAYHTLALIDMNDFEGNQYFEVNPIPIVGDVDGDGFVGITDLNLILANWNQNVPPAAPMADLSGDGFVGIEDLNTVLGNWNTGAPPTDAANIPEPGALALFAASGAVLIRRRSAD
jgi:hypothetical protein